VPRSRCDHGRKAWISCSVPFVIQTSGMTQGTNSELVPRQYLDPLVAHSRVPRADAATRSLF